MAEYAGKSVVFRTEAEVNEAIRQYEEETVTHFVTSTVMKSFSKTEMKVNRFRWFVNARKDSVSVSIPYDRAPFCFVGKKAMTCHMGEDRGKATKKKYQAQKAKEEAQGIKKYRQRATVQTKKSNCLAKISIKKIVKFPEYQLEEGKEQTYEKRQNNKRLLAELNRDSDAVVKNIQYYVKFPAIEDHKDHVMGEEAAKREPIDKRVHDKMQQLVDTGITSYIALQKLVYAYVEKELFKDKVLPPRTRRRYFPSLKDVQNYLTKYKGLYKKSPTDLAPANDQMTLMWDNDGNDVNEDIEIEEIQLQSQQGCSRSEQESLLTLLNTGIASSVQHEVVGTSTMAPHAQTIVPSQMMQSTHQMVPAPMATDISHMSVTMHQHLVQTNQEFVQTSHGFVSTNDSASTTTNKGQRKTHRIGLVCRMKALTHQLLDYSLLVRDLPLLQGFVVDLERMVENANQNATLDPLVVQKELVRNRRKRQAGPPVFNSAANKVPRLSYIL